MKPVSKRLAAAYRAITGNETGAGMPGAMLSVVQYAAQNPGLDPRDYISDWRDENGRRAYAAASRKICRAWHDVVTNAELAFAFGATDDDIVAASKLAWAGRLDVYQRPRGGLLVDYTEGQYWPVEYRAACAAVLAEAARIAQARRAVAA